MAWGNPKHYYCIAAARPSNAGWGRTADDMSFRRPTDRVQMRPDLGTSAQSVPDRPLAPRRTERRIGLLRERQAEEGRCSHNLALCVRTRAKDLPFPPAQCVLRM